MRKIYGIVVFSLVLISLIGKIDAFSMVYWEPENPLVAEIANELKAENELETAKNIWNWMKDNIVYYQPEPYSVSGESVDYHVENTILNGRGNCACQAYLAASLLIATGFDAERVRIGDGYNMWDNKHINHFWVEIYTDGWHRFDTTHTHTFEYEYQQELYEEGVDSSKIDYFYYEVPKNPPVIILKDVTESIQGDIHVIKFEIANEGEMRKYLRIEVVTSLEVIGSSHNFELLLEPDDVVKTSLYLRGEGAVIVEIGEIKYETVLAYDSPETPAQIETPEQEELEAPETEIQEIPSQPAIPQADKEVETDSENSEINIPKEHVRTVKVQSSREIPLYYAILFFPVFILLFFIRKYY
jgi:hypothetical protein